MVLCLTRIIERGQRSGEFDKTLSVGWLAAAVIALGHAAGGELAAERLSAAEAQKALRVSLLRLVGGMTSGRTYRVSRLPGPCWRG
ncbi:hypothetical protein AB0F15_13770 [Amycolatopsis sp. NPDC026612]|uniref:hypothetical protein n=1 Tax=Amycolatopsis sp. NPDC026612 TaxID=3155466 RepID=UPI0033C66FF9